MIGLSANSAAAGYRDQGVPDGGKVKTFIDLVNDVDNVPISFDFLASDSGLYKLFLPNDPQPYGFMTRDVVARMPWSSGFMVSHSTQTIQLFDSSGGRSTAASINRAFQDTIDAAIDQDIFQTLHRTHSEPYLIPGTKYGSPVHIERFTAPLFGIFSRGAHLTAFVRTKSAGSAKEEIKIYVARRSPSLFTYPNMLDTTVAGGVKASHTPRECILEEADEEASLPRSFVEANVKEAGYVSYVHRNRKTGTVSPTVLWCFDLDLTRADEVEDGIKGFVPKPKDGEVEGFMLMSVEEVVRSMANEEWKPNCNLVTLDFFLRHGLLDGELGGVEERLRRELPVPAGGLGAG